MGSHKLFKTMASILSATMLTTTVIPQTTVLGAQQEGVRSSAVPEVGQVVTKHTKNVEPDATDNGEEKDTYWKLVWSDEFNTGKLDLTKWDYQAGNGAEYGVGGWGNNEVEFYTDGDENGSENITFDEEHLIITAKKDDSKGRGTTFTSGKLWTKGDAFNEKTADAPLFSKKYGRIEAKMSLPEGTGLWPAFWMMPVDDLYGGWAASGEIDIMEARGRVKNSVDGTIHFGNTAPNNKNRGGQYDDKKTSEAARNFDFTQEHEYAIEWLPGEMKWYVDDECYFTTSNWYSTNNTNADNFTYPAPYDQPFYIMLNLAVGGNYDGGRLDDNAADGQQMKVDYVRVYDLCDNAQGTVHDYSADEQIVTAASGGSGGLMGGTINETNFFSGNLEQAVVGTKTDDGNDNPNNKDKWYLLYGNDASANVTSEEGGAKVSFGTTGGNDYSIQLMHQFPLSQGYEYEISFWAKADQQKTVSIQAGDYVYTNYVGSWTKYSDKFSVPLTQEWKQFTYRFHMDELTDESARVEINLGAGSGDAVYFRDATMKAIGVYEGTQEDIEKIPLYGGEQIYNGTFDQGDKKDASGNYSRLKYWDEIGGATATVVNDLKRSATITGGTQGESGIEQNKIQFVQNETYELTFDASSALKIKVIGQDESVYAEVEKTAGKNQKVEFQVPAGIGVTYGKIQFLRQAEEVVLDNVSLRCMTNNNADWANINLYPLENFDFSAGISGWNVFNDGPGAWQRTEEREDGLFLHALIPQGGNPWCVGVESPALDIKANINYVIRIKAKDVKLVGSAPQKTVTLKKPDGSVVDFTLYAGNNDEITIPFKSATDLEGVKMLAQFGANSSVEYGDAYELVLEYFDISVDHEKNNIPEEYDIRRAPVIKSAGGVEVGQNVTISHNDDQWANKISKIYVNDEEIAKEKLRIQSGRVVIDQSVFTVAGAYSIRFEATGYYNTKTITEVVYEPAGNLILNGTFDTDIANWNHYVPDWTNKDYGSFTQENGKAAIVVKTTESHNWDHQFYQENVTVRTGNYLFSFEASATKERPIEIEFANMGITGNKIVNITSEPKTYNILLSGVTDSTNAKINFLLNNVNGCLNDMEAFGEHTIYLDNISLKLASQDDVDAAVEPNVTLAKKPCIVNQNVEFAYTENAVWENKSISVKVNGSAALANQVEVDKDNNKIILDKSLFTEAKKYVIKIEAEGFNEVEKSIWVVESKNNILPAEWANIYKEQPAEQGDIVTNGAYEVNVRFVSSIPTEWEGVWMSWSMMAEKNGIATESGKVYELSFDADIQYTDSSIVEPRNIAVEVTGGQKFSIELNPGTQHKVIELAPGELEDYKIVFLLGADKGGVSEHTLNIRNIRLAEKSESDENETPETGGEETSEPEEPQTPGTGGEETSEPEEPQTPGTGSPQTPGTGNTPNSGTGNISNPGTGNTPNPGTGNTSNPGTGNTQTPETGGEESSEPEGSQTPETESPQTPEGEKGANIKIEGISKNIAAGKKVKLVLQVNSENVKASDFTWKTSNKKYAIVDSNGVVTIKKAAAGKTVTIKAIAKDGSGKTATYKINVMKNAVSNVKLSADKTVAAGKSLKVTAKVTAKSKSNKSLKWISSNTKYATVSNKGIVKTKKAGKGKNVKITAMATDGSNKKASITIKIK